MSHRHEGKKDSPVLQGVFCVFRGNLSGYRMTKRRGPQVVAVEENKNSLITAVRNPNLDCWSGLVYNQAISANSK